MLGEGVIILSMTIFYKIKGRITDPL